MKLRAKSAEPDDWVQSIPLRQPRTVYSQPGRNQPQSHPLLPVFFAGEENRFAAFVCNESSGNAVVGQSSDAAGLSPAEIAEMGIVLLVGPTGCGKSALAHHLATRWLTAGSPLLSITATDFARQYARAVDSDQLNQLRSDFQAAEVVLVDDVHQMVDKPAAQEELAARVEARVADRRPTLLTCRRLPTQLPGIRPLLASRMLPGLTVPIRLPGPAAARAIVAGLIQRIGLELAADDQQLLAAGLPQDVTARQIEGVLKHLELWCRMRSSPPTVTGIREALSSIDSLVDVSTDKISKAIARRYKLKLADLKSETRRQEVVRARSLAMYLSRQLIGTSYDKIGQYFGGRDHTTVLHAVRKIESQIDEDQELRIAVNEIADAMKGNPASSKT